ncbi:MAG: putative Vesicle transport protein GOT1A [Streblomastix strix]|uniref:Putative Vesicle transport protein GOT1A n=1 Tax=Streblomastix strix TaxID=222440 RepID=A0A5J4X2E4_9EUKA|nr:MAG: putative Vesicle transport protein GOT1A [Streblomastix strix]
MEEEEPERNKDLQIIGGGLSVAGVLFAIVSILLFFDPGFLAIGDILFILGLILLLGPMKAFNLFIGKAPNKIIGTVSFLVGIVLVFFKWAFVGVIFQLGGGYALFSKFMPKVLKFVTDTIPGASLLLQIPWLSRIATSEDGPIL